MNLEKDQKGQIIVAIIGAVALVLVAAIALVPFFVEKKYNDNKKEIILQEPEDEPKNISKPNDTHPKPIVTSRVKLIIAVNADFSNGEIYVDGKKATIIDDTPIQKTILVSNLNQNYQIEVKTKNNSCRKSIFVTKNNQLITICYQ